MQGFFFYKTMEILFWICIFTILCVITVTIYFMPYLGIVFVIVSIPFEGEVCVNGFHFYPLEVIMGILISVYIFKIIVKKSNDYKNMKLVFYYLPFMICILLSSLKFIELSSTIKENVRWLELIVIYFLTINLVTDQKKLRVILYSIFLTTVVVSICGVVNYLEGAEAVKGRPGTFSFFGHPNALAGYINLTIPVLFCMLMATTFMWERITLICFTILITITWFLTFSKSGWLSLVVTVILIVSFVKVRKKYLFMVIILFMSFAIISISSGIKKDFSGRLQFAATYDPLEKRILSYPIGFNMVRNDLLFGIGVGNYPLLIKKYTDTAEMGHLITTDLHNLYLQLFVEAGLIGLFAFVFWLTGIIRYLIRAMKSLENYRHYDIFVGLVGGVFVYLFNNLANVLTVHGIHLQWGIILGLAVLLTQFRESGTCQKAV